MLRSAALFNDPWRCLDRLDTLRRASRAQGNREANGANRYGKWPEGRFLNSITTVAQEVELENRYGSQTHRQFKSLPLRQHFLKSLER
jgi:hypothetical protein